jgi:hypothetical protein
LEDINWDFSDGSWGMLVVFPNLISSLSLVAWFIMIPEESFPFVNAIVIFKIEPGPKDFNVDFPFA